MKVIFLANDNESLLKKKKGVRVLGTGDNTKADEFSEKFQTAFDPTPLIFGKSCYNFFRRVDQKALFKGPKSAT